MQLEDKKVARIDIFDPLKKSYKNVILFVIKSENTSRNQNHRQLQCSWILGRA